jgi:hypothetical protein
MENIKIQYDSGYDQKLNWTKKNTMLTQEIDDYIYFGISRCNFVDGDNFTKKDGRKFAMDNLERAIKDFGADIDPNIGSVSFILSEDGLWGSCHKTMRDMLDTYFHHIDTHMWNASVGYEQQQYKKRKALEKREKENVLS